jgi:RnfABCDGE-type electron transport complex B subunit
LPAWSRPDGFLDRYDGSRYEVGSSMAMPIIIALVTAVGLIGALFGLFLAAASKRFAVKTDPKIEALTEVLPGINCGACGYPGCSGYAEALARGEAEANQCAPGAAEVAHNIARILGIEVVTREKEVAVVRCKGGANCTDLFRYEGIQTCRAASHGTVQTGFKACPWGCLGLGDCARVCEFGAITIVDGLPVIDEDKCTGCKACERICPKDILEVHPISQTVHVRCLNRDKGPAVKKYCPSGCIGCRRCLKACPHEAIQVEEFLARIDYTKCTRCGECVKVCPTKVIQDYTDLRSISIEAKKEEVV